MKDHDQIGSFGKNDSERHAQAMRLISLLSLVAGLQFVVPSASAVTVLSVTGVATSCLSTGGNLATGIVTAKSWTQTQGYANVNISAALDDFITPSRILTSLST
jgi:hypothetical protein